MSKTAKQILDRAFYLAGIKQEGIDLTDDEYNSGIDHLNALFNKDWAEGLNYPRAELSVTTDDTNLAAWSEDYIQNTVALRLCAEFNKPIPGALPAMAEDALRAVEKISVNIPTPYYSSILPTGGGENGFWSRIKYFGKQGEDDLVDGNSSTVRNEEGDALENETGVQNLIEDV
jgi:hypothetical protein